MDLSSALAERVDAVFADMDLPQHPGAALLVIDHGERLYSECYGLADLESQRPITADSSFYLASISKQFTAMAIMLLAEQGKLSFEDRLLTYFPRFPSWGAEITLRHMLHHTSGLPGYVLCCDLGFLAVVPAANENLEYPRLMQRVKLSGWAPTRMLRNSTSGSNSMRIGATLFASKRKPRIASRPLSTTTPTWRRSRE